MGREGGEWEEEEEVQDKVKKRKREGTREEEESRWLSMVFIRSLLVHIITYALPTVGLVFSLIFHLMPGPQSTTV